MPGHLPVPSRVRDPRRPGQRAARRRPGRHLVRALQRHRRDHPRHQRRRHPMTTLKVLIASGRFWAYVGSTLGATVSIAANIAHSYVPPDNAPAHWAPQPGAVVGAVVWPVFLFIAVEILA